MEYKCKWGSVFSHTSAIGADQIHTHIPDDYTLDWVKLVVRVALSLALNS